MSGRPGKTGIVIIDTDKPVLIPKLSDETSLKGEGVAKEVDEVSAGSDEVRGNRFDTEGEDESGEEEGEDGERGEGEGRLTGEDLPEEHEVDPLLLTKRDIQAEELRKVEAIIQANVSRVMSSVPLNSIRLRSKGKVTTDDYRRQPSVPSKPSPR